MLGVPAPVAWFPFAGWKDSCDADLHANGTAAVVRGPGKTRPPHKYDYAI